MLTDFNQLQLQVLTDLTAFSMFAMTAKIFHMEDQDVCVKM